MKNVAVVAVAEKFVGEGLVSYMIEDVVESDDECECVVGFTTDVRATGLEDVTFKVSWVQSEESNLVVESTLCEFMVGTDIVSVV